MTAVKIQIAYYVYEEEDADFVGKKHKLEINGERN